MRAFVSIGLIDDAGGVPVVPVWGRFWDGASNLFSFTRSIPLGVTDVEDDIRKAIIDDLVSYLSGFGLTRSDVVFIS